jgi:hypothetical protein
MTKRLLACCFITVHLSIPVQAGWIKAQGGQTPPNAIAAGKNRNGQPLYVCRAQYEGGIYPGTLADTSRYCSISCDGKEVSLSNYEILSGNSYSWVPVYNGEIPFDALPAGNEREGNPLYICRGEANSEWRSGKIRQTYGGCIVPYAGKELTAPWYEVLVGN